MVVASATLSAKRMASTLCERARGREQALLGDRLAGGGGRGCPWGGEKRGRVRAAARA